MFYYQFYHFYMEFVDYAATPITLKVRNAFKVTPKIYYYHKS